MFLRIAILAGAARDGVYAVNLKLIAQGNWRNVGMIGYQIGRKIEKKIEINVLKFLKKMF